MTCAPIPYLDTPPAPFCPASSSLVMWMANAPSTRITMHRFHCWPLTSAAVVMAEPGDNCNGRDSGVMGPDITQKGPEIGEDDTMRRARVCAANAEASVGEPRPPFPDSWCGGLPETRPWWRATREHSTTTIAPRDASLSSEAGGAEGDKRSDLVALVAARSWGSVNAVVPTERG
jgi:hypothetical protein